MRVAKIWNNKLTSFLAYSNIWVALSVASLTWISQDFFQIINYNYIAFTFFSTLAFYNYARFFEGQTLSIKNTPITIWHKKHRWLLGVLMIGSAVVTLYFIYKLPVSSWLIIASCGVFGVLYPIPYVFGSWAGIRHIAGLKLFVVAAIWSVITALLPALEAGLLLEKQTWIHVVQRLLFITAITIPFDIRDTTTDHPNIETLPMKFGINKAKSIVLFLGLLLEASLLLQYFQGVISGWQFLALFIGIEIAMILSYKSYPIKTDLYYSFLIEGTPIFMFLMVYVFKYF